MTVQMLFFTFLSSETNQFMHLSVLIVRREEEREGRRERGRRRRRSGRHSSAHVRVFAGTLRCIPLASIYE